MRYTGDGITNLSPLSLSLPSLPPRYAPVATVCNERKRDVMHNLETKIEAGIERVISIILATFSQILVAQKKSDYKPDLPEVTQASSVRKIYYVNKVDCKSLWTRHVLKRYNTSARPSR